MIDRSGEGWAESLADEEAEAVPEGGYDFSPQLDTPTRPALLSGSSSSFIRALPSPSSGAFTQDARILGWKIIGGRYKTTRDRNGNGRETGNGMWSGREDHDSGIDDPQKPGIGAYVGALPFCNLVETTLMSFLAVYECEVTTRQGTKILRMRRYNDFLALYTALRKAFPVSTASAKISAQTLTQT
jgi:hypothetical protein